MAPALSRARGSFRPRFSRVRHLFGPLDSCIHHAFRSRRARGGVRGRSPGDLSPARHGSMNPEPEAALPCKAYVGLIVGAGLSALLAGCGIGPVSSADHGRDVFKTCVPCHGPSAAGNLELRAPALAGLPDWYVTAELTKFKNDIRGAHPDDLEGHRMRPMARTLWHPGDVEAVAAYVSHLKPVWVAPTMQGNAGEGQKRYATVCIACHGPQAAGTQAMNAPPLAGQADWYLMTQLKKFKTGMRGMHPLDGTGGQMHSMSMTIPDTTAMHDLVAYIKTLPH